MELTTTFPLSSLLVLDTKVPSIGIDLHLALEWPMVWSRIPFATANLKTGFAARRANGVAWPILWSLVVDGVQDPGILIKFTDSGAPYYTQSCRSTTESSLDSLCLSFLHIKYYIILVILP